MLLLSPKETKLNRNTENFFKLIYPGYKLIKRKPDLEIYGRKNFPMQGPALVLPNHLRHEDGAVAMLETVLRLGLHLGEIGFWAEAGMLDPEYASTYVSTTYKRKKNLFYKAVLRFSDSLAARLSAAGGLPVYPNNDRYPISREEADKLNRHTIDRTAWDIGINGSLYVIFAERSGKRESGLSAEGMRKGPYFVANKALDYQLKSGCETRLPIAPAAISQDLTKIMFLQPIIYDAPLPNEQRHVLGELVHSKISSALHYMGDNSIGSKNLENIANEI